MCFLLLDLILVVAIVCIVLFVLGITSILSLGPVGYWFLLAIALFLILLWAILRFFVDCLCHERRVYPTNAAGPAPYNNGAAYV
jgi:hypothetical protein